MKFRRPACVLLLCSIVGCDRALAPTTESSAASPARSSDATVVASAKVTIDGAVLDALPPFLRVTDRGTVVDVEVSSEPFATTRPTSQAAIANTEPTAGATTGYHLLMSVPVASIDDLASAEWTQTLSTFPEDSADGFFTDDGHVQIVPANVRAGFSQDGPTLTVHLRGTCFRRSDEADAATQSVEVDSTFVGQVVTP